MKNAKEAAMRGTKTSRITDKKMREESGQSLIELALVLPIFAVLLLGAAEFGQLLYDGIEVSDAARAGVAYGAQSATTAADTNGMEQAAIISMANLPGADSNGLVANDPAPVQLCSCSNSGGAPSSDCVTVASNCAVGGGNVITYVQVNTKATIAPLIHIPGVAPTFTLTGQAIMRVE